MSAVRKKYNGVQILRAILFIGIVAFHSGMPGSQMMWGGVEVFFVLSSYFLTKKLSQVSTSEIKVIPNIKHRIIRLIPVYYLVLTGAFFVVVVFKQKVPIGDLMIHSVFSQNINWMINGYKSALVQLTAHTWTLSIDVYLFCVWLVAFKLIKTHRARQIFNVVCIVCAGVWRTITTEVIDDPMITSLCPVAHMDAFAIGSTMALSEKVQSKKSGIFNWILGVCGLCIIFGSIMVTSYLNEISFSGAYSLYNSSDNYLNNILTCNVYLGFSLLGVGLIHISKLFRTECKNMYLLERLGSITYSAYLIHYPVNVILRINCKSVWVVFILTLCVSITCAAIIEKILVCINEHNQGSKSKRMNKNEDA